VIATEALLAPVAVGLKVTLIEQLPPAATLVLQVLVCAKSPLFVPVIVMLVRFRLAPPLFERVIVCAAVVEPTNVLENVSDPGTRLAAGATPVPVNVAV
jgi:hypothetical protein